MLTEIILSYFSYLNYLNVAILMTIESSFVPFPSEIVIPPAAYVAARGLQNIWLVIIAGTLGSVIGAVVNYFLARYLGRAVVYRLTKTRIMKILGVTSKKIERSEKFFLAHGKKSTFIGRLIPVVRQLISLPAGFARMNFGDFLIYTFLGSALWVSVLAGIGYYFGSYQTEILYYLNYFKEAVLIIIVVIIVVYIIWKRHRKLKKKLKIVFMGTPEFAIPSLQALVSDEYFELCAVITQPDMPVGRKQILTPSPVKIEAQKNNILVIQPVRLRDIEPELTKLKPDIIIVVAFGKIIPKSILDLPRYGCINVHPSLLPKYRGAAPVHSAILQGDTETGVTIMLLDENLDTGPILSQEQINIEKNETTINLLEKTAELGARILIPTIKKYVAGEIAPMTQDDSQACYVKMFEKNDGRIDWSKSALEIERLIRALGHWPGAWTMLDDKQIKITEVRPEILDIKAHKPGEIFTHENFLTIQCGTNALIIEKLKIEGKNEISGPDFIRGYKNLIGKILNS